MKITNIHDAWGSVIELETPLEFFEHDCDFWRGLMYARKLLLFKKMTFTKVDYVKFIQSFGDLWQEEDYKYSLEGTESVYIEDKKYNISPMSNKISTRLGMDPMDWHSDIPNKSVKSFPMRSLWITKNPNPESGLTSWLNIEHGLSSLPLNLAKQVPHIKIVQQSWYQQGTDIKEFDFVKIHPVTNQPSLRLNYFNDAERNITNAWIRNIKVFDQPTDKCKTILGPYLKWMQSQPELIYTHKWDLFDLIIYDNFPLLHKRTRLEFDPSLERLFYRANIDH